MDVSTSTPSAAASPLRQRMLDDMRMRQFAEHTQEGYIRAVRKLCTTGKIRRQSRQRPSAARREGRQLLPRSNLGLEPLTAFTTPIHSLHSSPLRSTAHGRIGMSRHHGRYGIAGF